jgi:outer membrane protein TolC
MEIPRFLRPQNLLTALLLSSGCVTTQAPPAAPPALLPAPTLSDSTPSQAPLALKPPQPTGTDRPMPINLATALRLANARPLDIAVAQERVAAATAQLDRARAAWLPTVVVGGDYFRHDGQAQDTSGSIVGNSRTNMMVGAGPTAVLTLTDAIFAPLAARQIVAARNADVQANVNDSTLAVAEAYFSVQQSRGELAAADGAASRAAALLRKAEELTNLIPPVEVARIRTELYSRQQIALKARERWRLASADLNRVLRLDPSALVEPEETPDLRITLIDAGRPLDELVTIGLTNRPELAAQQALVQAALERIRQERMRPFLPSMLFRGASTNPTGTLGVGYFGGGKDGTLGDFGARSDLDLQLLWEFQNLGFGNKARVDEQRADHRVAVLESFRTQDRIASEVAVAQAQLQSAVERLTLAELALREALVTANKTDEELGKFHRVGNLNILISRPLEAVAAVQALAQASADYYGALGDANRAQFRLYRALGQPAQAILSAPCEPVPPDVAGDKAPDKREAPATAASNRR